MSAQPIATIVAGVVQSPASEASAEQEHRVRKSSPVAEKPVVSSRPAEKEKEKDGEEKVAAATRPHDSKGSSTGGQLEPTAQCEFAKFSVDAKRRRLEQQIDSSSSTSAAAPTDTSRDEANDRSRSQANANSAATAGSGGSVQSTSVEQTLQVIAATVFE